MVNWEFLKNHYGVEKNSILMNTSTGSIDTAENWHSDSISQEWNLTECIENHTLVKIDYKWRVEE